MSEFFSHSDYAGAPLNIPVMLFSVLLAFLIGQAIAWVYMATHSGLSYSKSFVNSLIVIPIIVSVVMGVMNNNLVTAFGMMAVFSIVRFRNILRDTFDSTFVLWALAMGMACGTHRFPVAVIGGIVLASVILYLSFTNFGARQNFDLIVNLQWSRPIKELDYLTQLLDRHSLKIICASQRAHDKTEGADLSYRVLMRDPERVLEFMNEIRDLEGVSKVTSLKAEEESEV